MIRLLLSGLVGGGEPAGNSVAAWRSAAPRGAAAPVASLSLLVYFFATPRGPVTASLAFTLCHFVPRLRPSARGHYVPPEGAASRLGVYPALCTALARTMCVYRLRCKSSR